MRNVKSKKEKKEESSYDFNAYCFKTNATVPYGGHLP